jgi:hypothetical protein
MVGRNANRYQGCAIFTSFSLGTVNKLKIVQLSRSDATRLDDIVPFAMEFVGIEIALIHLFCRDLALGRILAAVQSAGYG